jgi:hypothetical protein
MLKLRDLGLTLRNPDAEGLRCHPGRWLPARLPHAASGLSSACGELLCQLRSKAEKQTGNTTFFLIIWVCNFRPTQK